ncbi:MAG: TRAP transporter large permease [Silicimonas sp.]|jgi:C4-dicarboxylate transporter DctM subunit|uniref:TRAP transporter large permease n=1 Tax=Roseovarius sp. TaxID=1486281 RepID=UPI0032ECD1B5
MISLIWLILFLLFLAVGVPVSISIGLGAMLALLASEGTNALMVPTMLISSMDSFILTAVPLFMLTGAIMQRSTLASRLFGFADSLVGWSRGGMGHASIVASMIFGGISGSAVSDAAALGPMSVQMMKRTGYSKGAAGAIAASSSTLAAIIPPSIIMVVYSVAAGVSASKMLVAGIVPGLMCGFGMMIVNVFVARASGLQPGASFSLRRIGRETRSAGWAIFAPAIIVGGLFSGLFTPTEAGLVAAVYSFLVAWLVYRSISIGDLGDILVDTGRATGVAVLILATASLAAHILASEQIPQYAADLATRASGSRFLVWVVLVLFFLIVGMFLEGLAAIIILMPVFLPFIEALNIDPIHFGVVFVVAMCIGLMTPPVGVCLFVISKIGKIGIERLSLYVLPYVLAMLAILICLICFPGLSLFLTRFV